jgi:hypothetical protein
MTLVKMDKGSIQKNIFPCLFLPNRIRAQIWQNFILRCNLGGVKAVRFFFEDQIFKIQLLTPWKGTRK